MVDPGIPFPSFFEMKRKGTGELLIHFSNSFSRPRGRKMEKIPAVWSSSAPVMMKFPAVSPVSISFPISFLFFSLYDETFTGCRRNELISPPGR